MVQHACAVLGSVALFDEGSQNIQTTELFRTFQDVIVPERPAVHCSVHRGKLQRNLGRSATHPKNRQAAESPHLSLTDEPCWQSCAARGRPRQSYREHHRSDRWSSLQHSLVHGIGRLTTAPLGCMQLPKQSTQTEDIPRRPRRKNELRQMTRMPRKERKVRSANRAKAKRRVRWASIVGCPESP